MSDQPAENPPLELDARLMFCEQHLAPFQPSWPNGYLLAATLMFTAFSTVKSVWEYAQGDSSRLQNALREFGPVCCLLEPELTRRIVKACLAGDMDEWRTIQQALLGAATNAD